LLLRDDREDFDPCFCNVIEHPDLINPESVLWLLQAAQPLDAATTQLGRLVTQMSLDGASHPGSNVSAERSKLRDRCGSEDNLEPHLARL